MTCRRWLVLDVGGYNPLLGTSYGELAADSRSMHKSQGFGVARSRAPTVEYFQLLAAAEDPAGRRTKAAATKTPAGPFDGLDFTWARFAGGAPVAAAIGRAVAKLDPAAPYASLPALAAVDTALDKAKDAGWRAHKQADLHELMVAFAGVFVEATAPDFRVAPGSDIELTATAINRSPAEVTLTEVRFPWSGPTVRTAPAGRPLPAPTPTAAAPVATLSQTVRVPEDMPATTPYWLAAAPESGGLYRVSDRRLLGAPESPPAAEVVFGLRVAGRAIELSRAVAFKWVDPVAGERYRPLEITPLVSVAPDTGLLLYPEAKARTVSVTLTAGAANVTGVLRPEMPPGWASEPASAPFTLPAKGSEATIAFRVRPAPGDRPRSAVRLRLVAEVGKARFDRGVVRIVHDHIPIQTLLRDASVQLVPIALATGGTRIGYFPGPGDEVPASLRRVGYDVTLLGPEVLAGAAASLVSRFDAIVVGVRAFNTDERLRAAHAALMSYVEAGGRLVLQYNTNNRLAPLTTPLGPWPFTISAKRVTDETAAVTFTTPAHPAVTAPNRLDAGDFQGWVQERGLYFADGWDGHYETPLTMHDRGEPPLAGGLLWARYGKGVFVYTGLSFFRQLPAGVPGAYRLFANLLAGGAVRGGK